MVDVAGDAEREDSQIVMPVAGVFVGQGLAQRRQRLGGVGRGQRGEGVQAVVDRMGTVLDETVGEHDEGGTGR